MNDKTLEQLQAIKEQVDVVLHDPMKLRMAIAVLGIGLWYQFAYSPIQEDSTKIQEELRSEQERLQLARDINELEVEAERFLTRLPQGDSRQGLKSFVSDEFRELRFQTINLATVKTKEVGPYPTEGIRVGFSGPFQKVEQFLRWAESAERMLRIVQFTVEPVKGDAMSELPADAEPTLNAELTIMGTYDESNDTSDETADSSSQG